MSNPFWETCCIKCGREWFKKKEILCVYFNFKDSQRMLQCDTKVTMMTTKSQGPWNSMIASMARVGRRSCRYLRTQYLRRDRQGSWWCSDEANVFFVNAFHITNSSALKKCKLYVESYQWSTWPVVSFFLASVVPRSARNWSRPPPSAIFSLPPHTFLDSTLITSPPPYPPHF